MSNIDPYIHTQVWESKKAVRAIYCGLCSNSISCSPKLQLMFLMAHVFIFNLFLAYKCILFTKESSNYYITGGNSQ